MLQAVSGNTKDGQHLDDGWHREPAGDHRRTEPESTKTDHCQSHRDSKAAIDFPLVRVMKLDDRRSQTHYGKHRD